MTVETVNDASRIVIDGSRLVLQIVASHTSIMYNCNMFTVQPLLTFAL